MTIEPVSRITNIILLIMFYYTVTIKALFTFKGRYRKKVVIHLSTKYFRVECALLNKPIYKKVD